MSGLAALGVLRAGGTTRQWAGDMLGQPFMRHALLAGTAVAAACGLVGYFVVLRGQVFTGDALSHVAFTGALAALAVGIDARLGLFAATIVVGVRLGLLGGRGRADDVVDRQRVRVGARAGRALPRRSTRPTPAPRNSAAGVNVLFGSIFGLSAGAAATRRGSIAVGLDRAAAADRPAAAVRQPRRGRRRRRAACRSALLGSVFLVLVGVTAAEATQAVGALLLLGLLAAPAGAAQRLTDRPWRGCGCPPAWPSPASGPG